MQRQHLIFFVLSLILLAGCGRHPMRPILPDMKADVPVHSQYSSALDDLNTVLEVYLPPEYPNTYYYVKPVVDATGVSSSGEIPTDITAIVREAVSQVHYKVRYVEQYDVSDVTHLQAEIMLRQAAKLQVKPSEALRPNADFIISGRISQFDRNLTSSSTKMNAMGEFGAGDGKTNLSGNAEMAFRSAQAAIAMNVYDSNGVSVPGRFGASMKLEYGKNSTDLGFAILGTGFGLGAEATAMHGRHYAMQMMAELSVIQIIGRTMTIPYWRVGGSKIFKEDPLVVDSWREYFAQIVGAGLLVPFMQSQCIANGDTSVQVTGRMDGATRAALERFAAQYGVSSAEPSFALFKALEENRILEMRQAVAAWSAYNNYKSGGAVRAAAPATMGGSASAGGGSAVARTQKTSMPSGSAASASTASQSAPQRSSQERASAKAPKDDIANSLDKLL